MKKLILIALSVLLCCTTYSQNVNIVLAQKIATNYFKALNPAISVKSDVSLAMTKSDGTNNLFYVFDIGTNGFVIVSGDMAVTPILAYSDEGKFEPDNQAPALVEWLQNYADAIAAVKMKTTRTANPAWAALTNESQLKNLKGTSKGALLATKWDQTQGYNDKCPVHASGPGGHCVTGCVATALAMVLKYYNYPDHGIGSHSYQHPFYGTISADFANTTYDYASMTNTSNSASKDAISTLIFHCGVAVDMYYTPIESGSSNYKSYVALRDFFHYRIAMTYESKSDYLDADWRIKLRDNLDQNMPILYSGSGSGGGHAWVCDGYTDTTKFHFNWGWSGSNNGYYTLANLNPGGYDFTQGQDAIFGIAPYFAPYCAEGRTLTDYTKTFTDGSDYSYYWNNTTCDWLIKPPAAQTVQLIFNDFKLEDGKDFVSVYDGTSTSGTLLGTFTGHNYPPALTASSGKMFITFTTDGQNQDLGWTATYTSVVAGIEGAETNNLIALWPVPAADHLNLLLSSALNGTITISIFDIAGKLMLTKQVDAASSNSLSIDVSNLAAGSYILEAIGNDVKIHKKFVK
ncbi:MAG: C10 family peptidase [Bacteroidota bacterium]